MHTATTTFKPNTPYEQKIAQLKQVAANAWGVQSHEITIDEVRFWDMNGSIHYQTPYDFINPNSMYLRYTYTFNDKSVIKGVKEYEKHQQRVTVAICQEHFDCYYKLCDQNSLEPLQPFNQAILLEVLSNEQIVKECNLSVSGQLIPISQ